MIRIVEGNPGSGKTYYAMNYLCKYCDYDKVYDEFVIRSDVMIISNIEGLRIKHKNLDAMIEQKGGLEEFFTVENFENLQKVFRVNNIILVIDEAQKYFDSKFFNKTVFYLFQYHRHLGLDVILITQSRSTIARHLIPLAEHITQAVERSKLLMRQFKYRILDLKGNEMYTVGVPKKQDVFRSYKSFNVDEMEKPKNVVLRYVVMLVIVLALAGGSWKFVFSYFSDRAKPVTQKQELPPVPPAPVPDVKKNLAFSNISSMHQVKQIAVEVTESWQPAEITGYIKGNKTIVYIDGEEYTLPHPRVRAVDLHSKTCQVYRSSVHGKPPALPSGAAMVQVAR